MRIIVSLLTLLVSMQASSQEKKYTISKDPKNGELVFNGRITFDDLNGERSFTWMKEGRNEYKPEAGDIAYLQDRLKNYKILVLMGTWCSDSQDMVPRFEKVLQAVKYPEASITMYGVTRSKKTKDNTSRAYKVKLVPTIILLKDGKEVGRITRKPPIKAWKLISQPL